MPTYFVRSLSITSALGGDVVWYCVIRAADGVEICRTVTEDHATQLAALCVAAGVP